MQIELDAVLPRSNSRGAAHSPHLTELADRIAAGQVPFRGR
jgi:hypothetical protein